jgi:hypothetical protein
LDLLEISLNDKFSGVGGINVGFESAVENEGARARSLPMMERRKRRRERIASFMSDYAGGA